MRSTISVKLSKAERQTLEHRAQNDGRALSTWIRMAALNAAGGVSSEWDAGAPPAWARKVAKVIARAVRAELRTKK